VVRGVDLTVDVGDGYHHEGQVLADAAGLNVIFVAHLGGAEPGAGTAVRESDVEILADANDLDCHRVSQRVIGSE
jgi:hypothetical protein